MHEDALLKAITDMEDVAKGHDISPGMSGKGNETPKSTSAANGGLSGEGDVSHVDSSGKRAAKSEDEGDFDFDEFDDDFELEDDDDDDVDVEKGGKKGGKKTLAQWAKEELAEDAHKGGDTDDDDDESMDDPEAEKTYKGKKRKKMKKSNSVSDLLKSNSDTGPVIDVAPFIENLVDTVSDAIDGLRQEVRQIAGQQTSQRRVLKALGNLSLDLKKSLGDIMESPAGERRTMLSKSEVIERFEDDEGGNTPDFSRDQVLDAMVDLVQKSVIQPVAVSRYESTGSMEADVYKSVEEHLRKSA